MTWDITSPADTDPIRQGASAIRTFKTDLQSALQIEGVFPGATPASPVFRWKPRRDIQANRPANDPVNPGTLYYNTDLSEWEVDTGTAWVALAQAIPIGSVSAYAATSAPAGWLLCDGSAVSRTTYVNLFGVIGISHGSGDGSTTFNLPDYRGRFLRGVDGAAGRDPNNSTRTAMNSGGNTGNLVGSVEAGATALPVAPFTNGYPAGNTGVPNQTATGWVFGNSQGAGSFQSDWARAAATNPLPAITNVVGGDAETRPINANVTYIIKF